MNKCKNAARKRHIRQSINRAKLEGRTPMANGGNKDGDNILGCRHRDTLFAIEVAATQAPYTTETPAQNRRRLAEQK